MPKPAEQAGQEACLEGAVQHKLPLILVGVPAHLPQGPRSKATHCSGCTKTCVISTEYGPTICLALQTHI